mmetsp:Transcript_163084/g.522969  ORF Transcript_163084/g.522969 Transcript_163084/m.522969 type:complete len:216 (-) Transcript_163084:381-1028(-)
MPFQCGSKRPGELALDDLLFLWATNRPLRPLLWLPSESRIASWRVRLNLACALVGVIPDPSSLQDGLPAPPNSRFGKSTWISSAEEEIEMSSRMEGTSLMSPRSLMPTTVPWEASVMLSMHRCAGARGCGRLSIIGPKSNVGSMPKLPMLPKPKLPPWFRSDDMKWLLLLPHNSIKSCMSAMDSAMVGTSLCMSSERALFECRCCFEYSVDLPDT